MRVAAASSSSSSLPLLLLLLLSAAGGGPLSASADVADSDVVDGDYDDGDGDASDVVLPPAVAVNYTDVYDGLSTPLRGYLSVPPGATPSDRRPAVIAFPDWDGVNEYEIRRARMLASDGWGAGGGYVALAADVYGGYGGPGYRPETRDGRIEMVTKFRTNGTLANARVQSAIEYVMGLEEVDAERGVVILGYCFGGTLVLNHALSGQPGARTAIAYHGSVSAVPKDYGVPIQSRVVIYTGGEDTQDSTKSIAEMEVALNAGAGGGGGTDDDDAWWEIDRYGPGVTHGFTKFGSDAYDAHVDERTWESTGRIIRESFGEEAALLEAPAPPEIDVEEVSYVDPEDGTELVGYVSVPTAAAEGGGGEGAKFPAVVIIHDASGVDDYEKTRATMLAELGYVGFAADVFGSGHGSDPADRAQGDGALLDDVPLFVRRIDAGIAAAGALPSVDGRKVALIGYGLGGTGVIDYALSGNAGAVAAVSFHGGLSDLAPVVGDRPISVKMNVQSGGDDDAPSSVEALEEAMEAGNATRWEYARYSGAGRSFTNWNDDDGGGGTYDVRADVRSWESMRTFLDSAFEAVDGERTAAGDGGTDGDGVDARSGGAAATGRAGASIAVAAAAAAAVAVFA